MHPFKVVGHLLNGLVVHLSQLTVVVGGHPVAQVVVVVHQEAPNPLGPLVGPVQTLFIPRHRFFQRPHEHFVQAQGVGPVLVDDVIRVHHVALGLGHLFVVGAQDHPLVNQIHERFLSWYQAKVVEDLVPETGVQEV